MGSGLIRRKKKISAIFINKVVGRQYVQQQPDSKLNYAIGADIYAVTST